MAALADAARLSEGLAAGEIGDTIIDLLRQSGGRVETDAEALKAALSSVKDESLRSLLSENIDALLAEGQSLGRTADELTLALFSQKVTSALKTLNTAEDRLNTAFTAIAEVYSASDLSHEATAVSKTAAIDAASPEQALTLLNDLAARATELQSLALNAREEAAAAQSEAARVSASDTLTFEQRLILLVGRSRIGIMFTGALFLLAGIILLFFAGKFLSAWKRTPLFSTLIAALVMIVIQTYSLGFAFDSYGAWGNFWLVNFLNVLRANASVGMIALGMTFVIITGGIDLAVGSDAGRRGHRRHGAAGHLRGARRARERGHYGRSELPHFHRGGSAHRRRHRRADRSGRHQGARAAVHHHAGRDEHRALRGAVLHQEL